MVYRLGKPGLGSAEFVWRCGTKKNMCWQTSGDYGCSLCVKIVGLTFLHGGSSSFC